MKRIEKPREEDDDYKEYSLSWNRSFIFDIESVPNVNFGDIKYDPTLSRPSKSVVDTQLYCELIESKNQIDTFKSQDKMYMWNMWSRLVNPYEKIGAFSSIKGNITISRAFFKLYEILTYFNVEDINTSLHLCEAPGGFVKATLHKFPNVDWWAQTLYEGGGHLDVSGELDPSRWIRNGDGNICILDNIIKLGELNPVRYDLITGDGGFDVSYDPNNQEQLSFKLIYSQFLTALHYQNNNGTFVCKIFDSMTKPTCQLVYMMRMFYQNVYLIKPRSSRFINSEKYIVCLKFLGVCDYHLKKLDEILLNWDDNVYCRNLGVTISKEDYKKFKKYNNFLAQNQINYINKAVNYCSVDNNSKKSDISNFLETMQNKRAHLYCVAFNLKENNENCDHSSIIKNNICYKCLQSITS